MPAQALDEGDDGVEHVLAVVEHQEHGPVLDELFDGLGQCEVLALLDVERAGDEGHRGVGVAHGGQLDEGHLRELSSTGAGHGHRQTGLADASRPADRDDGTLLERLAHDSEVAGSADQLGGLTAGQGGSRCSHRAARRSEQGCIVGEDLRFQGLHRRREAEAHLVAQHRAQLGAPA